MDFGYWTTSLFSYGESVGYYWLAIMAGVVFVASDYADWLAPWLRRLVDRIPPRLRRPLEVVIMVAVIFVAGFSAWQDQRDLAQRTEMRRQSAVTWLATWKTRADDRWGAIHDKGGYLDQIEDWKQKAKEASNKPPKTVIEHALGVPLPKDRSAYVGMLQKLYAGGGFLQARLLDRAITVTLPPPINPG